MRLLPVLTLPLFAACILHVPASYTTFTATNQPNRPMRARAIDSVEVYTSTRPLLPYTEVGILRTNGDLADDAVKGMREEAARVGCDGVIVTSTGLDANNDVVYNSACFLYADDTTWRPPAVTPSAAPRTITPTATRAPSTVAPSRDPRCAALLAEVRAAPNDAKPRLSQRVPPECFASGASTSPGS